MVDQVARIYLFIYHTNIFLIFSKGGKMSIVHIVKVTGKSKADLVKALKGAIRELDGETISSGTTVTHTGSTSAVVDEEGYEEVESPYTNHAPAEELYGRGPVEIQHPNNTIVDNESSLGFTNSLIIKSKS
jgi:hypothetical protein